jgi:hypothetical protein
MSLESLIDQIHRWVKEKSFMRIEVVIKKVGRNTIMGRIMQFDRDSLLVYNEDEKKVDHIMIHEIDDILSIKTGKQESNENSIASFQVS